MEQATVMAQAPASPAAPSRLGRSIGIVVVIASLVLLAIVVFQVDLHPRTDDASVRANYIEIAPEVSGRLTELPRQRQRLRKAGRHSLRH